MLENMPSAVGRMFDGIRAGMKHVVFFDERFDHVPEEITVTSPAFQKAGSIPIRFTEDGERLVAVLHEVLVLRCVNTGRNRERLRGLGAEPDVAVDGLRRADRHRRISPPGNHGVLTGSELFLSRSLGARAAGWMSCQHRRTTHVPERPRATTP